MSDKPRWTVLYNIVSPESKRWVGTGWEFFDTEEEAQACYDRHNNGANCASKRPWHPSDKKRMGAAHQIELRDA